MLLQIFCLAAMMLATTSASKHPNNMIPGRTTIVHLFEWKWRDIADECERFLGPKGYGGIQISPPSENLVIYLEDGTRSWYERYQVMSYNLTTRSGNESDFLDMTTRCNKAGVRIYADVVVNHMTAEYENNTGTGGNTANFTAYNYPAVPYTSEDFHYPYCSIVDYNNATNVRNCELLGLKDLNQTEEYVRGKIADYFNHLIELGVAGFRVDAAKHMWPGDLKDIYSRLSTLKSSFGFHPDSKPYIYHEVIYSSGEAVLPSEYTDLGDVTEFGFGSELSTCFRGDNDLKWLINWGESWNLAPRDTALVFIDNHDTQRDGNVLNYTEPRAYRGAIAFMLAHPYGKPSMMSSFDFSDRNQGPPSDANETIISPIIYLNGSCGNGWVCEHRWHQMYQMVAFRNAVGLTGVYNWWNNTSNQIAFSRGDRGFVAFNLDSLALNETLQTGLPEGTYCDVISGERTGTNQCTGVEVDVAFDGTAEIYLPSDAEDMHLAIHVGPETGLPEGTYCDVISGERTRTNQCTGVEVDVAFDGTAHLGRYIYSCQVMQRTCI